MDASRVAHSKNHMNKLMDVIKLGKENREIWQENLTLNKSF
jgi:hypothetical protein